MHRQSERKGTGIPHLAKTSETWDTHRLDDGTRGSKLVRWGKRPRNGRNLGNLEAPIQSKGLDGKEETTPNDDPSAAACGSMTAALLSAGMLSAQTANQSSAQSPYYGSVTVVKPTDGVKPLTIDQAIGMGIEHNLALIEARQQELGAKAQTSESLQSLLPTVTAQADSGAHQINLAALGFSSSLLATSRSPFSWAWTWRRFPRW